MRDALRPFLVPLAIALLATLLGHGLGIAFGVAEDSLKAALQASATTHLDDMYGGDAAKAKSVVDKSWSYLKRAHMHAGAIGNGALVVALLLAFLGGPWLRARQATALAASVGALGYGVFWLVAGFAAPGLGGTAAAKEAYWWLGMPTSGLVVVGTVGTLGLVVASLRQRTA